MRPLYDIAAALALLTRLPAGPGGVPRPKGAWAWPVAGLAVGAVAALVGTCGLWLGLPPGLVAGLALGAQVMATGGLHEDGLADCADGLWGGGTPQRRLEIMRDSRVGSYGVLALVLSGLLRWQGLAVLAAAGGWTLVAGLIVVSVVSRAPMVAIMARVPAARPDGLSRMVGRPTDRATWGAIGLAAAATLILWPAALIPLALLIPLPALWLAALARRRIGGQTGDVLGASQQLAEITALCCLAALL